MRTRQASTNGARKTLFSRTDSKCSSEIRMTKSNWAILLVSTIDASHDMKVGWSMSPSETNSRRRSSLLTNERGNFVNYGQLQSRAREYVRIGEACDPLVAGFRVAQDTLERLSNSETRSKGRGEHDLAELFFLDGW